MSRTLPRPTSGRLRIEVSKIGFTLCGLFFEVAIPLAFRGEAVHARAMVKRLLRRADVRRLAAPGLQRRVLQRAAVAEGERPGERTHAIHRVEVRGRVLVGLPAREEHDAGKRGGDGALEHADRA